MTRNAHVFPLFAFVACSGNSKEETADTSVSDGVSFDLATGEYTLRLTHNADSDLSCGPGFAYVTEE